MTGRSLECVWGGAAMPVHRSPPPLSAEVTPNCFIVRDANGQALSYLYYESETGRRSAAKLLNRDEAPRIAANIAKLPEPLQGRLFTEYSQVNRRSFFACMRGLILAMTIRIVLIFAAAVMIAPSLAYGLPTCMTISEARAKFPNETLYSHQHCWNVSAAHGFRALVFRAFGFSHRRGSARAFTTRPTRGGGRAFTATSTCGSARVFTGIQNRQRQRGSGPLRILANSGQPATVRIIQSSDICLGLANCTARDRI